jgi:uncharacterized lipoprotein YddW (UPF0748 family)
MSRLVRIVVAIVSSVIVASAVGAHATRAAAAADEVRGLWVQHASLVSPDAIAAMVNTARDGGFNTVFVQVRARGEAFYNSAIEPRASELDAAPASFDPLATALDVAHRAGLRVHAWINVNFVASAATLPRSRSHVVFRHPEWLMVPNALAGPLGSVDPKSPEYVADLARWTRPLSAQIEGLYLSPISEDAQRYLTSVVSEIATKYAVDGIHLDYLRFPSDAFDYSRTTLAAFRAEHASQVPAAERQRLDARAASEPAIWTNYLPEGWTTFRRDRLTALATRLAQAARAARPQVLVTAAVGKNADESLAYRFQDWRGWSSAGVFDALCPMLYTVDAQEFSDLLARAKSAARDTPIWAGIGAFQLPVATTADRLRLARRAGAGGFVVFSYDNLIGSSGRPSTYLTALRPAVLEPPAGDSSR